MYFLFIKYHNSLINWAEHIKLNKKIDYQVNRLNRSNVIPGFPVRIM